MSSGGDDSTSNLTAIQAAMNVADIIRRHVSESEESGLSENRNLAQPEQPASMMHFLSHTPGLLEGAAAASVSLVAFVPIRRVFLGAIGRGFGDLPNIFMTASQLILSADAGLLTCSLVGSRHYLQSLSNVSATAASPTADKICANPLVSQLARHPPLPTQVSSVVPAEYDPRVFLAEDLQRALNTCRQRDRVQNSENGMQI